MKSTFVTALVILAVQLATAAAYKTIVIVHRYKD